jgi:hypothetical protein
MNKIGGNSLGPVVIRGVHEYDEPAFAINAAVNDYLPVDKLMLTIHVPNRVDEGYVVLPSVENLGSSHHMPVGIPCLHDISDLLSSDRNVLSAKEAHYQPLACAFGVNCVDDLGNKLKVMSEGRINAQVKASCGTSVLVLTCSRSCCGTACLKIRLVMPNSVRLRVMVRREVPNATATRRSGKPRLE